MVKLHRFRIPTLKYLPAFLKVYLCARRHLFAQVVFCVFLWHDELKCLPDQDKNIISVEYEVEISAGLHTRFLRSYCQYSAGAVLRDSRNPTFGVNWGNVGYQIKPIGRNVDRNTLGFNNMPLKTNFLKENGGSPNFRGR
jgi:hypothetical protein